MAVAKEPEDGPPADIVRGQIMGLGARRPIPGEMALQAALSVQSRTGWR